MNRNKEPDVWCMNIKDNRGKNRSSNKNPELKFEKRREKGILAIGWSVNKTVHTWEEYRQIADEIYEESNGYTAARNNMERLKAGDLVWVKNPVTSERYIVEIQDNITAYYGELDEFDIGPYRHGKYYSVSDDYITGDLSPKKLSARRTIEKVSKENRGETILATRQLYRNIKKNEQEKR